MSTYVCGTSVRDTVDYTDIEGLLQACQKCVFPWDIRWALDLKLSVTFKEPHLLIREIRGEAESLNLEVKISPRFL
jgi:hypothetical protein